MFDKLVSIETSRADRLMSPTSIPRYFDKYRHDFLLNSFSSIPHASKLPSIFHYLAQSRKISNMRWDRIFMHMYPRPNTTSNLSIVELASSALAIYRTYAALNLSGTIRSKTWERTFVHDEKHRGRDCFISVALFATFVIIGRGYSKLTSSFHYPLR